MPSTQRSQACGAKHDSHLANGVAEMKRALLTLLAVAVLAFVWYDGVKHGYQMAITDLATGSASAGTARGSSPSLRL